MEILVVDNHSDDESISFLRAHLSRDKRIHIIETIENIGYGRGNNQAAAMATGDYLLIINPDNTMPPETAEKMISFLQDHLDVGVVGPALVHDDGTIRPSARPFPHCKDLFQKRFFPDKWMKAFEKDRKAMEGKEAVTVDWMVGACLLLKKDLFREVGGFDDRFFLFFEDIDLCRKISIHGKKAVYLPSLHVADKKERLSGMSIFSILTRKATRIHLQSAMKYFWKWMGEGERKPVLDPMTKNH